MHNPAVAIDDPLYGSFAVAALDVGDASLSSLRGWPAGRWWDGPLLFWDEFSSDGELGPVPDPCQFGGSYLSEEENSGWARRLLHVYPGLALSQPNS